MKTVYFDFYGRPAKILLDEAETPDVCEIYDVESACFERCDHLILDVMDSHGSHLISEGEFSALLEKLKAGAGQI